VTDSTDPRITDSDGATFIGSGSADAGTPVGRDPGHPTPDLTGSDPHPVPVPVQIPNTADQPAETELQRLHRLIRQQFAGAVAGNRLDIDLANSMLAVFGFPELPRRWSVRIALTFLCTVTAESMEDAFGNAEDAIANAVAEADCHIDVARNGSEHHCALACEIDHTAL